MSSDFATLFELPCAMLPSERLVTHAGRSWTYAEVRHRSIRLASALREMGVGSGSAVAIMSTNHPVWLEGLLATSRLGAHLVGLNYRAKEEELRGMLEHTGTAVAFVESRYVELVRSAQDGLELITLDAYDEVLAAASDSPGSHEAEPKAIALMLFTSGTTSAPKPVVITNADITAYISTFADLPDLTRPREISLVSAPLYHVAGFFSMLTSVYGGREVVLSPQFDRDAWLRAVSEHRVTHAFLVPTMLKQLLTHPDLELFDLSSLTRISYGAAPMPLQVIEQALERLPAVQFSNAYGQTETFGTVCVLEPADHKLVGSPEEVAARRRRLASVGRAVPGVRIKVCAEDGSELPAGQVGEVWVGREGPSGEEPHQWTRTGDLGHLDADGYLFLGGRLNDLIIRGGENVAPAEIESVLLAHSAVEDVAVIGVPDEEWGEAIVAFVVPRNGATASEEEFIEWVRARAASYKKPQAIRFLATIPRNATGKTDRRALRRLVDAEPAAAP